MHTERFTEDELRALAMHEAAHAIIADRLGCRVIRCWISDEKNDHGFENGATTLELGDWRTTAIILMAGPAQDSKTKRTSINVDSLDYKQCKDLLIDSGIDEYQIGLEMGNYFIIARGYIAEHQREIVAFAEILQREMVLEGQRISAVLRQIRGGCT